MNEHSLYELVAEALGVNTDTLTPESGLNRHPAWDSLAHVRVILAIESACRIKIDDTSAMQYSSMKAIANLATSDLGAT